MRQHGCPVAPHVVLPLLLPLPPLLLLPPPPGQAPAPHPKHTAPPEQHHCVKPALGAPQVLQSAAVVQVTVHPPPLLLPLLPLPPLLLLLLLLLLLELLLELLLLLPLLLPLEVLTAPSSPPSLEVAPESSGGKNPRVFAVPALHAAATAATTRAQALSMLRGAVLMIALPIPRWPRALKPISRHPCCSFNCHAVRQIGSEARLRHRPRCISPRWLQFEANSNVIRRDGALHAPSGRDRAARFAAGRSRRARTPRAQVGAIRPFRASV